MLIQKEIKIYNALAGAGAGVGAVGHVKVLMLG